MSAINWDEVGVISGIVIAVVGAASFIVAKIFALGKVAQRLSDVETGLSGVQGDITGVRSEVSNAKRELSKDFKDAHSDLTKRIDDLMKLMAQAGLSASSSPRHLTEKGEKVLKDSGIDTIVDDKFDYIVKKVQEQEPENPYQAEQDVLRVVESLNTDGTVKDAIERGAFNSGQLVSAVLFVGGLYVRDRVLEALGFDVNKIDDHTPQDKTQ